MAWAQANYLLGRQLGRSVGWKAERSGGGWANTPFWGSGWTLFHPPGGLGAGGRCRACHLPALWEKKWAKTRAMGRGSLCSQRTQIWVEFGASKGWRWISPSKEASPAHLTMSLWQPSWTSIPFSGAGEWKGLLFPCVQNETTSSPHFSRKVIILKQQHVCQGTGRDYSPGNNTGERKILTTLLHGSK